MLHMHMHISMGVLRAEDVCGVRTRDVCLVSR